MQNDKILIYVDGKRRKNSKEQSFGTNNIDTYEGKDVVKVDIIWSFLQTQPKLGNNFKFTDAMLDIICQLNPI